MQADTQLRDYLLETMIGEGGMAEVWRARHVHLDKDVAIKIMAKHLVGDAKFEARFLQEAKAMARLQHPHIVGATDFFIEQGAYCLVMPYLGGGSLADLLDSRLPLEIAQALSIAVQILSALDHAHQNGIIHRDVKPSNILLDQTGQAFLADFGIALLMGEDRKTKTGTAIGTPHYMSPEQIMRPKTMDHRSDVYSFGCVLFEMLTGRPPFDATEEDGDTDLLVKTAHLQSAPPTPRSLNPRLPVAVEATLLKALAKDPAHRFLGCAAFATALEAALGAAPQKGMVVSTPTAAARPVAEPNAPAPKRPRWRWAAVAGAVVVGGLIIATLMGGNSGGTFTNTIGMSMVAIPGGSFAMGSTESGDEQPVHTVQIPKAFHMASTEVTQGQWEAVMGTRPWAGREFVQSGANYPAVYVSWEDAQDFCRKLSAQEGKPYRLPSEAEWENAARAGGQGKWCFGNDEGSLGTYAWFDKNAWAIGEKYAHLVGTKQANAFGLHDMHGNVWEWCEDTWHDSYAGAPSDGSAWVINGNQADRVYRGGSFTFYATNTRSALRYYVTPDFQHFIVGFRVVYAART